MRPAVVFRKRLFKNGMMTAGSRKLHEYGNDKRKTDKQWPLADCSRGFINDLKFILKTGLKLMDEDEWDDFE